MVDDPLHMQARTPGMSSGLGTQVGSVKVPSAAEAVYG